MLTNSNEYMIIPKKLLMNYHTLGINEQELVVILQLHRLSEKNNEMPSFEVLSEYSTLNISQIAMLIEGLIQKDILKISVDKSNNKYQENFSLESLNEKLNDITVQNHSDESIETFKALFERFEFTFSRLLTPIEIETLKHWIDTDHHSPELINAALNEAAAHEKLSFKYIDRILLNWKKRNVQTIDDSKKVSDAYKNQKTMVKTIESFPVFDWVNGDNPYDK